uniref:Uncharacterized protein n=1 Tax=Castor canadensis TaxID=51338 RepID=A0A8C0X5J3_CASCN
QRFLQIQVEDVEYSGLAYSIEAFSRPITYTAMKYNLGLDLTSAACANALRKSSKCTTKPNENFLTITFQKLTA